MQLKKNLVEYLVPRAQLKILTPELIFGDAMRQIYIQNLILIINIDFLVNVLNRLQTTPHLILTKISPIQFEEGIEAQKY